MVFLLVSAPGICILQDMGSFLFPGLQKEAQMFKKETERVAWKILESQKVQGIWSQMIVYTFLCNHLQTMEFCLGTQS